MSSILTLACNKVPLLAPTGSSITLTAGTNTLPVGGSTDLIAQVLEAAGTPPQDGTLITFTTTLGSVQPPSAETKGGRAIVRFTAGNTSGEARITATSGGAGGTTTSSGSGSSATSTTSNVASIKIGGAAVETVTVSASSAAVPAAGGTVTLTASANDVSGNRLPGVPIIFTTTAGTLGASVVNTDQNGVATTTLTTARAADVTVTAGAKTAKVSVGVNTGPVIALGPPSPANPTVGQVVTFTITLTPPGTTGAAVRSVIVDFGDGSAPVSAGIASSTPVTHIYNSQNTYTVTATATDVNGEHTSAVSVVTVGQRAQSTVSVSATPQGAAPGTAVTVTATATPPTGTTITSLVIDFGDGSSHDAGAQATAAVPHVYQASGSYTVRATARDSGGGNAQGSTVVIVGNGGFTQASFTVTPTSPVRNQPAAFDASASTGRDGIQSFSWKFGDGSAINNDPSPTQSHTYTAQGAYNVELTVTDNHGGKATVIKQVTVSF